MSDWNDAIEAAVKATKQWGIAGNAAAADILSLKRAERPADKDRIEEVAGIMLIRLTQTDARSR
jgi:hypothetical protein